MTYYLESIRFHKQLWTHAESRQVGSINTAIEITKMSDANDGLDFATTGQENDKRSKKKVITCYKCQKPEISLTYVASNKKRFL